MKRILIVAAGALVAAAGLFYFLEKDFAEITTRTAPLPDAVVAPNPAPFSPEDSGSTGISVAGPPAEEAAAPATAAEPRAHPGGLLIPVTGIAPNQLIDTFNDKRGGGIHEAIDIMAPLKTPVVAVDDGKVVKLFNSVPGGLTLYQFDATEKFAYYYAHLDSYASGVVEGKDLKRGDLLGYVGVTGNANPLTPHLHFAVFELGPEKHWWEGSAINPYPLFQR